MNPADGSCWVADLGASQVVHLASDGTELWRGGGFNSPTSVAANSSDNSCWVADSSNNQVVHLAANGTELWRGGTFNRPRWVAVDPGDNSCWVADTYNHQVVHLAEDGAELWRGSAFNLPTSVSFNPTDGSCWVADYGNNQVVHLASDGSELWRGGAFNAPYGVSVSSTDGACWVADTSNNQIALLNADGTEVWRGSGFSSPFGVSVDPTDGSCWVGDYGNAQAVHLAFSYTLSLDGANGQVKVDGVTKSLPWSGNFNGGTSVALEAVADATYEFANWSGGLTGSTNPTSITMDGDKSVTANFSKIQYTLSLSGSGEGTVKVDGVERSLPWSSSFDSGSTVSLEAVAGACYEFANWSGDLTGSTNPTTITMDSARSVTANFGLIEYTLSLTGVGGGSVVVDGSPESLPWSGSVACSSTVTLQAVPDSCYQFAGWSGDLSGLDNPTTITMDGAKAVTVNFTLIEYNLTLTGAGDGSVLVNGTPQSLPWSGAFVCGSAVTLQAVPGSGYEFSGWAGDLSGSVNPTSITMDGAKAVTLNFAQIEYALGISGTGGSVTVDGVARTLPWTGNFTCDSTVTLAAVADSGKEFSGWSGDLTGSTSPTIITMDGEKAVTAHFSLVQHTVTLSGTGSGSVLVNGVAKQLPYSGAYDYGTALHLEAVPAESWSFRRWSGDVALEQNPIDVVVESDMALTAVFGIAFSDVPEDYWAGDAIEALTDAGLVRGYPDGQYRPEALVDRGAMAVYISRALAGGDDQVPAGPEEPTFPDTTTDHWAFRHVEYAYQNNIVGGYGDGNYHAEWQVTRGQMAVFIARAVVRPTGEAGLESYVPPTEASFSDVSVTYWCFKHVAYLVKHAVASGYPDGLYRPTQVVTRGQMAVYITRAFGIGP